ncbi:MAG TPA: condensation domain-containing protein, partial [Pseudonocardiaceae bacterium]|nr:condensation domain-containing protein [Pseudonocardiaceae bacterium]
MTDQAIAPDTAVSGAEMPLAQRLPLSFAQQQLWFLQQLAPDMTAYHVHVANRLSGPLDIAVLRRALTHVLRRHEILRSTYHSDDGTPYQIIGPPCDAILEVVDHPGLTATDRDAVVEREFAAVHARPFDLTTGPLNRFLVVRLADDDHAFAMYFHHIVIDGWSMTIFNTELAASYRAFLAGVEPDLPELDVRYRDFVAAQQDWSARELPGELDYWQQRLAALPALELPADRPRSRNAMQGTDAVVHDLDPALVRDLRAFASEHGASLFVLLTTAFNVVLARYSGQYDIPVGVAMLGRTDPDLEYVIGIFVNMVVLRSDLSGDPTFAELFGRTDDAVLDLFDHQDAPFEKVVERVQPAREPGRNPLFQVAVQMLEAANSGGGLELGELGVDSLGIGLISAMFDLNLNFFEVETGLRAHLSYATELFDRWRIENLLSHLEQVLRAGIADPSLPLSQLPLMSAEERDRVRQAGQGAAHVDPEEPVHVTVAAVAAAKPDTTAAVCKGIELSYRDLDHRAEQLARHINATGVGHEQVVAIAMDRDLDTLIAMLAVWKAGAA